MYIHICVFFIYIFTEALSKKIFILVLNIAKKQHWPICFPKKYQFIRSRNRILIAVISTDTAKAILAKCGPSKHELGKLSCSLPDTPAHTRSGKRIFPSHHLSHENKVV